MLAKVDIEDAQRLSRRGGNELLNRIARSLAALGETAQTDRIGVASGCERFGSSGQEIPRNIILNGEVGESVTAEADRGRSCRRDCVDLHVVAGQSHSLEATNDFMAEVVFPNAGNDLAVRAQGVRMIGKVCGSTTHLRTGLQQVPEHFSDAYDVKVHRAQDPFPVVSESVRAARPWSRAPWSPPR